MQVWAARPDAVGPHVEVAVGLAVVGDVPGFANPELLEGLGGGGSERHHAARVRADDVERQNGACLVLAEIMAIATFNNGLGFIGDRFSVTSAFAKMLTLLTFIISEISSLNTSAVLLAICAATSALGS